MNKNKFAKWAVLFVTVCAVLAVGWSGIWYAHAILNFGSYDKMISGYRLSEDNCEEFMEEKEITMDRCLQIVAASHYYVDEVIPKKHSLNIALILGLIVGCAGAFILDRKGD